MAIFSYGVFGQNGNKIGQNYGIVIANNDVEARGYAYDNFKSKNPDHTVTSISVTEFTIDQNDDGTFTLNQKGE